MALLPSLVRTFSTTNNVITRYYTVALTRRVSPDIAKGLSLTETTNVGEDVASYEIADKQHLSYLRKMQSILPTFTQPFLPGYPDCCFVEDTLVASGRTVVMTNPGHDTRQGEAATMGDICRKFGMEVIDMKERNPEATLDGGDVLNTGRHMYIGLTNRTNSEGFRVLEKVFGDTIKVVPVKLPSHFSSTLHLKSVVTHLDNETLLVPDGKEEILSHMLDSGGYECIVLPDISLTNVVVVNGNVLAQKTSCQQSEQILEKSCEERSLRLHWLDMSELAKVDGALTCCSVLLDI